MDLLPHDVHLLDRVAEFETKTPVVLLPEFFHFYISIVVAKKGRFKCERVCHLKLFPHDHSASSHLARVNLEPAAFVAEHVRVFRQNSGQKSYYSPGQEASVRSSVTAIEETIFLFRVPVQITVDVDFLAFFFLVKLFGEEYFWM